MGLSCMLFAWAWLPQRDNHPIQQRGQLWSFVKLREYISADQKKSHMEDSSFVRWGKVPSFV